MNSGIDLISPIAGYRLIEQLYSGSKTLVYRAIREIDRLPAVIKLLNRDYPSFSELLQFRNQYTIAKNLRLPGVLEPCSLESYRNSYALVMIVLAGFFSEVEQGYRFGRVALSLLNQLNWLEFKCITLLWFGCFIQHRQEALRAAIPTAKQGYLVGMETGDFLNAGYCVSSYSIFHVYVVHTIF
ncbi:hypothetical protein QUA72_18170 [Microcoleus sp. M2_B4]